VGRPPRYEDESAGRDPEFTVPELEGGVSIGDVERLVGVRVKVKGWPRLAWRERPNQDDVGPLGLGRAEARGLRGLGGQTTVQPLIVSITSTLSEDCAATAS